MKLALNVPAGQPGVNLSLGHIGVDVYDAATAINFGTRNVAYSVPAVDGSSSNGWRRSLDAGTTNLFQMVDDQPEIGDYLIINYNTTNGGTAILRFKGATQWKDLATNANVDISAKRIVQFYISASIQALNSGSLNVTALLSAGTGGEFLATAVGNPMHVLNGAAGAPVTSIADAWNFAHWRTYEPLRAADALAFVSSGTGTFGLLAQGLSPGSFDGTPFFFVVYNIRLNAVWVEETRMATGWTDVLTNTKYTQWVNVPLVSTVNGAAIPTLTKTAGTQLAVVVRTNPKTASGSTWRSLDTTRTADRTDDVLTGIGSLEVPFFNNDIPDLGALLPDRTSAPAVYLLNAGTVRVDGNGYLGVAPQQVRFGANVEQEFSNASANPYALLSVLVLNDTNAHLANTALVLQLFRRSDNAAMTSAVSITTGDLPPVDNRWYKVTKRSASGNVTLTNGVQYYLRATSAAGGAHPWTIQTLSTLTSEAGGRSFGGVTDVMTATALGERVDYDAILQAGILLAPIQNANATIVPLDTSRGLLGACTVPSVNSVFLTWTPSTLGANFMRYEIDRRNPSADASDPDTNWYRIAQLTQVSVAPYGGFFFDVECRRNVPQEWRIRQVASDGSFSDWASFPILTVGAGEWDVVLASNTDPTVTVGTKDQPGYEWRPVETPVVVPLYGVDKQVAFRETERRGEEQTRKLLVAFNENVLAATPTLTGRVLFDALDDLFELSGSPYTCLCDGRGRRWFTSPHADSYSEDEPLGRYVATVTFAEVHGPTPATN